APGRLPEPAAAGLLELLDEARGALRGPADLDPAAKLGGLGTGAPEAEQDEARSEQGGRGRGVGCAGQDRDAGDARGAAEQGQGRECEEGDREGEDAAGEGD